MRILIVEDEMDMSRILQTRLEYENYIVDCCYSGTDAKEYLQCTHFDAVIMDIMLPGMNGLEVLKELRASGNQVPVLLLSAKGDTKDIVQGLDAGADDYLVKPFDFRELLARLRMILRKKVEIRGNVYRCGDLELDTNQKVLTRDGERIPLSPREYAIIQYLIRNQGIVVTRQQIVDNIYNIDQDINSNVIDVYIRLLRKKIDAGYDHKLIHTIRGMGYVLRWNEKE